MPTAPLTEQRRLLDVQSHDTHLARLIHQRATLPEIATEQAAQDEYRRLDATHIAAKTRAADMTRELAKAEGDVEQVRARAARNAERLESGSASPKDALALSAELESLAHRQSDLEDLQLAIMEEKEAADTVLAEATEGLEACKQQILDLRRRIAAAQAQIDEQIAATRADRAAAAEGVGPELLALYEKIRSTRAGVGAARLAGTQCEGCRMDLNPVDLSRIKALPEDAIARCEECSRILVRV